MMMMKPTANRSLCAMALTCDSRVAVQQQINGKQRAAVLISLTVDSAAQRCAGGPSFVVALLFRNSRSFHSI